MIGLHLILTLQTVVTVVDHHGPGPHHGDLLRLSPDWGLTRGGDHCLSVLPHHWQKLFTDIACSKDVKTDAETT